MGVQMKAAAKHPLPGRVCAAPDPNALRQNEGRTIQ